MKSLSKWLTPLCDTPFLLLVLVCVVCLFLAGPAAACHGKNASGCAAVSTSTVSTVTTTKTTACTACTAAPVAAPAACDCGCGQSGCNCNGNCNGNCGLLYRATHPLEGLRSRRQSRRSCDNSYSERATTCVSQASGPNGSVTTSSATYHSRGTPPEQLKMPTAAPPEAPKPVPVTGQ